ncbi:hypothetical protein C8Q74DRAFT_1370184 [Fomes fomentarius]|nr:hypothetical protein C8Q74DRAFT_1370184 [Fomes fomentarius]
MYCFTKRYGSESTNRQAGCCGSCFKKSFDEDEFADRQAAGKTVSQQPPAQNGMLDKPSSVS